MQISIKSRYVNLFPSVVSSGVVISLLLLPLFFVSVVECRQFSAWRFDLKFDVRCGSTEFVVLGYMLFNGLGAEKKAGRHFPKNDYKPFLYAQLDQTPDLSTAEIIVGLELRVDIWDADKGPRFVTDMLISMIHVGETLKLRLRDLPLKNDTADFTHLSMEMKVSYEDFERQKKNDCYVDATYYLHGEVATSGYECLKTILVCRCDDGVTSQNCQLVPQKCSVNGAHFDRQTADTVCKWKMNHCCPEVDCPLEPLAYCLNEAARTRPLFVVTGIVANFFLFLLQ